MNPRALLDALRSKKAGNVDVTILLNDDDSADAKKEQKELGLAPEAKKIADVSDPDAGKKDLVEDAFVGESEEVPELETPKDMAFAEDGVDLADRKFPHSDEEQDKRLIHSELAKAGLGKKSLTARVISKFKAAKKS